MPPVNTATAFGLTLTLEQWVQKPFCRIGIRELRQRLLAGVPADKAITEPPTHGKRESRFKGVSWHVNHGVWIAQIRIANKVKFLGNFDDDVLAAKAYDAEARPLGRKTNFHADAT